MIKNLTTFVKIAEEYIFYLKKCGIKFNKHGFPLLKREMFLDEWPGLILPYDFRKSSLNLNSKKTLICFYCGDKRIYPRLENLLGEIIEYRKFLGVATIDITVTSDMDEEWQDMIMLLHQLFMAVLAINGIKVIANLRTGGVRSVRNLDGIPKGVMWATGFLGCAKESLDDFRFVSEVLHVMPSKLVIYGPEDQIALDKLDIVGINFRIYDDYHCLSKKYKRSA